MLDGQGSRYILPLTISTVIQFSLTPLIPVFFAGALGMREVSRITGYIFAISALAEIIAAPFGIIFYYDEAGTYLHGECYIVYELFYVVSMLFLISSLFIVAKRFEHRDTVTVVMIFVLLLAAIIPLIISSVHAEYIGIAASAALSYIYYNDLVQQDIQKALSENREKVIGMTKQVILSMANLIESRDFETGEHVARTSAYVKTLAELAREDGVYADELDDHFVTLLQHLAPLHDVGKIVVPDGVLRKPGRLTDEEFEEMKKHAAAGDRAVRDILEGIADEATMKFASDIAMYHHEKWNGKGYPEGLSGEDIPLCARIMAVADVYDALVSERCYKKAMTHEQACKIIEEDAGTHFDPKLAKVFLDHNEVFRDLSK